jgi:uncharacterized phiE125 gp8 family phage protein
MDGVRITSVTPPSVEPITLNDVKMHLRRTDRREDDYFTEMIKVARQYCEHKTRRAFITQTWNLILDKFPMNADPVSDLGTELYRNSQIRIPVPPLQSVTHVKYYDTGGTQQTRDSGKYVVDTDSQPGRVYPAHGQVWPETRNIENAVEIQFVAGYGDAGSDVPEALRHAIKLVVSHWCMNREPVIIGSISKELETTLNSLLWMYRNYEVA